MSRWHNIRVCGAAAASVALHGAAIWALIAHPTKDLSLGRPAPALVEVSLVQTVAAAPEISASQPVSAQTAPQAQPAGDVTPAAASPSSSEAVHMASAVVADGGDQGDAAPALNDNTVDLYGQVLMDHIRKYRNYPVSARRAHIEGEVILKFVIDRQGRVQDA